MAKPETKRAEQTATKPEHVVAFAIVPRDGLYVARTMHLTDGRVTRHEDSEPDTRLSCVGRVMRAVARD